MKNENEYVQIYWTCANLEEAKRVSAELLSQKLVACANIFPEVLSLFVWKGQLEQAGETKVIFKTRAALFPKVRDWILKHASYEVPEILQVPIIEGNPAYLKWVQECTTG